jgi:hypothetical protein
LQPEAFGLEVMPMTSDSGFKQEHGNHLSLAYARAGFGQKGFFLPRPACKSAALPWPNSREGHERRCAFRHRGQDIKASPQPFGPTFCKPRHKHVDITRFDPTSNHMVDQSAPLFIP